MKQALYSFGVEDCKNQIVHGDALDFLGNISKDSVDLLLTDIPYNGVNRKSGGLRNLDKGIADILTIPLSKLVPEMVRVTKGSGYIFCGWEQLSEIVSIIRDLGISNRVIVWEKTNPSPMNGQSIWLSGIELAVFFKKPNATYNQHCKNCVVRFPSGRGKLHPTEKPLKLFEHLVEVSSNGGDVVCDPFMGSWTTAVASKNKGRNFVGTELSEEFCKIGQERLNLVDPFANEKVNDEYFER